MMSFTRCTRKGQKEEDIRENHWAYMYVLEKYVVYMINGITDENKTFIKILRKKIKTKQH